MSVFQIQLEDDRDVDFEHAGAAKRNKAELKYPVDLDLEHVLGSMPRKVRCSRSLRNTSLFVQLYGIMK